LGMKSAYSDNSYGGLYCTARDLARFGQFLLNRGTFNGIRFFSEETFKKMLPQKLVTGNEWGIGISPMNKYGLSPSVFGHGAASGSVFRVDPENDLIIISARNRPGKFYKEFEKSFIESCIKIIK
ncbi:MAG: serine hydrolase, partial [Bacillota bacterium]